MPLANVRPFPVKWVPVEAIDRPQAAPPPLHLHELLWTLRYIFFLLTYSMICLPLFLWSYLMDSCYISIILNFLQRCLVWLLDYLMYIQQLSLLERKEIQFIPWWKAVDVRVFPPYLYLLVWSFENPVHCDSTKDLGRAQLLCFPFPKAIYPNHFLISSTAANLKQSIFVASLYQNMIAHIL